MQVRSRRVSSPVWHIGGAPSIPELAELGSRASHHRGSTIHLEFHGAAQEATGSCHILRVGTHTVLLDCGLFQGNRKLSVQKNRRLPVPVAEIDAVVLSHAHIQEKDAEYLARKQARRTDAGAGDDAPVPPLYAMRDATQTIRQMIGHPYDRAFDVVPGVRTTFVEAGHRCRSTSTVRSRSTPRACSPCTPTSTTRARIWSPPRASSSSSSSCATRAMPASRRR